VILESIQNLHFSLPYKKTWSSIPDFYRPFDHQFFCHWGNQPNLMKDKLSELREICARQESGGSSLASHVVSN
jgi:hypothetical protein